MMVPSATNTTRYHGLSQFIRMKHPGFTAENGYIPESTKTIVSTHIRRWSYRLKINSRN